MGRKGCGKSHLLKNVAKDILELGFSCIAFSTEESKPVWLSGVKKSGIKSKNWTERVRWWKPPLGTDKTLYPEAGINQFNFNVIFFNFEIETT